MSLDTAPVLMDGVVVDTADPQEMGRVRVWCPAVDGPTPTVENLPWAQYVTPFGGQAYGYQGGGHGGRAVGPVSYGFWGIPKLGAQVIIGFLYGDYNQRIYLGSVFPIHGNRSLPTGRNVEGGAPITDSLEALEPQLSNLKAQFQGDMSSSVAKTRGAYERQVAQASVDKTTSEGYDARVISSDAEAGSLDPQTYCVTTPGRHSLIFQDNPKNARVRLKSADGSQIILDDANERIYVSVARGKAWLELDRDGHVHVYAADSISLSSGKDVNISAAGSVNISAGAGLNLLATGEARLSAGGDLALSGDGKSSLTAGGGELNLLASGVLKATGATIQLNGPPAAAAPCATSPTIVPSHEPWTRPASSDRRGPNWKP